MSRVNKATEGLFAKLFAGNSRQIKMDEFLESNNPESPSANLRKYTKIYKDAVNGELLKLERISLLEELVMQMKSRENITDIKVTFVRNYIYARTPFYRRDRPVKDVRVLVDNREFWKKYSINKLYSNEGFMEKVREKLLSHMTAVIDSNLKKLAEIDAQLSSEPSVIHEAKKPAPAKPKAKNKTKKDAKAVSVPKNELEPNEVI